MRTEVRPVSTCFLGGDIYTENTSCHFIHNVDPYFVVLLPYTYNCVSINVLCLYMLYGVVSEIK